MHRIRLRVLGRCTARVVTAALIWSVATATAGSTAGAQNLSALGHTTGSPEAPVEVIEFLDFGCGQCASFSAQTFGMIEAEFINTGKVRWRSIPFASGRFRHSAFAAEAAECAGEQGHYFAMHDSLLANQSDWSRIGKPDAALLAIAKSAGVDTAKFSECVRSERTRPRVRESKAAALSLRVYGTPTFLLQRERRVIGAAPFAQFREILRTELDRSNSGSRTTPP